MTGWSAADDRAAVSRWRRVSYPAPVPTSGRATGRCRAATPGRTRWCRGPAAPPRPIVDVDHPRRRGRYGLATTDQAQDGIAADRQGQPPRQPCAGLTTQHPAALGLHLSQPVAAARLARARPGTRSAKVRSGQRPQRKRRPCFRQVTDRSCRDRSLKVRSCPLGTRAENARRPNRTPGPARSERSSATPFRPASGHRRAGRPGPMVSTGLRSASRCPRATTRIDDRTTAPKVRRNQSSTPFDTHQRAGPAGFTVLPSPTVTLRSVRSRRVQITAVIRCGTMRLVQAPHGARRRRG